jgi:hypothetical protein
MKDPGFSQRIERWMVGRLCRIILAKFPMANPLASSPR